MSYMLLPRRLAFAIIPIAVPLALSEASYDVIIVSTMYQGYYLHFNVLTMHYAPCLLSTMIC